MSGGWIPYHLRWNKSIDRSIFMEFLIKLNAFRPLDRYRYVGFGAVHMEDFKLMHSMFSITNLTCIEQNKAVYDRQSFNKPLGCIELKYTTSGEYIAEYDIGTSTIIWLDYAKPKDIGIQIRELQALLPQLNEYDVVKITLNANPDALCHKNVAMGEELFKKRLEELQNRVDDNLPDGITSEMMKTKQLPSVLYRTLNFACSKAMLGRSDSIFYPVTSFVYADSMHQMITYTGIILKRNGIEQFLEKSGISDWSYFIGNADMPQRIDMPDLTLRERFAIDSLLPCNSAEEILSEIKIQFDDNYEDTVKKVESYIKFYRHYPYFSKINL